MAPGGGWDEAVAKNLEAGFYNHRSVLLDQKVLPLHLGSSRGNHSGGISGLYRRPQWRELRIGGVDEYLQEIDVEMAGTLHTQESSDQA